MNERKKMDRLDALIYAVSMYELSKVYYETVKQRVQEPEKQDLEMDFYLFSDSFHREFLLLRIDIALANNEREMFMALTEELKRYEV